VILSPGVKRSGSEVDHSSPSSGEIKNGCSDTSTHPQVFMLWCLGT